MIKKIVLALIVIALVVFFASVYTVKQTQQALVLRLGNVEHYANGKPKVMAPGLHFRIPYVQSIRYFDMRLHTLDIQSSRVMTAEQKDVLVDAYVKWRITNLVKYFVATGGDQRNAMVLLSQKVNDGLRATFGQHTIPQLLSDTRTEVMTQILKDVRKTAMNLGISINDVRIKRIDLPEEVAQKIYARMISAREKTAAQIRADGEQQAEIIRAKADATVTVTLAKANSEAAKIRAKGDAKAAGIYAKAYDQNTQFYAFYRSLAAYQSVFATKQKTLVLRPHGQFFRFFHALPQK